MIQWKEIYEVGVDFIDADHRKLAEMINDTEGLWAKGATSEVVSAIAGLERYFEQHCAREEAAMRKIGFDGIDDHIKDHVNISAQLRHLAQKINNDKSEQAVEAVVGFLGRWFHDHVIGQDLQLKDAYRAAGVATSSHRVGILDRIDRFLARFKVGTRILAAALIPTILAIGVTILLVHGKYGIVKEMEQVQDLSAYAVTVGNLVHELQRERGLSALSLGGDPAAATELAMHYEKVNIQRNAVTASPLSRSASGLTEIDRMRTAVRDRSLKTPEIVDGYTSVIAGLLKSLGDLAQGLNSASVTNRLTAYLSLTQGKERAGQERAIGTAGFSDTFQEWRYIRFVQRAAQERAFFNTYLTFAAPDRQQSFKEIIEGPAMKEFEELRAAAKLGLPSGSVDPKVWFAASSKRLETLKALENEAASDLRTISEEVGAAAKRDLIILSAVIGGLLVIALLLTVLIVRSVVRPFLALADTIRRIGSGEKDTQVLGTERRDEIGEMARTVMVFRAALLANDTMLAEQSIEHAFNGARIMRREALTKGFDDKVSQFVGILASSSTELVATANEMNRVAGDTTHRSTAVAAASEETSVNIQTVASAIEELSASIKEITRQVEESASISSEAVNEADKTDCTVASLADAAGKIGDIVKLIVYRDGNRLTVPRS
jgi:hemerythrin-like metal-binding protein